MLVLSGYTSLSLDDIKSEVFRDHCGMSVVKHVRTRGAALVLPGPVPLPERAVLLVLCKQNINSIYITYKPRSPM